MTSSWDSPVFASNAAVNQAFRLFINIYKRVYIVNNIEVLMELEIVKRLVQCLDDVFSPYLTLDQQVFIYMCVCPRNVKLHIYIIHPNKRYPAVNTRAVCVSYSCRAYRVLYEVFFFTFIVRHI